MNLKKLLEHIKETCIKCEDCDPCCTKNILKKCIENERVVLRKAGKYASVDPASHYCTTV